jgi:lipopolysaccharide/colanic/teichoic acid biosynthesis glycosyltransferase
MSIVGPRPAPPREVEKYSIWHRRRLAMRPGLTGLWQVSARSASDFDRRVELDLDYINRWSLWMDIKILLRTIPVMMSLEGR